MSSPVTQPRHDTPPDRARAAGARERCDCEVCFYCDRPLARRHEHDHFPVPAEAGGTETVPTCLTCHDLVDRDQLSATVLAAWADLTPEARMLVAHGLKMWHRYRHRKLQLDEPPAVLA